jgi:hypothetical protein
MGLGLLGFPITDRSPEADRTVTRPPVRALPQLNLPSIHPGEELTTSLATAI